jgi:hypothetical protein
MSGLQPFQIFFAQLWHDMLLRDAILGKPLASSEEAKEELTVLTGVPVLGLDALASTGYGPEAALTILLPLGVLGLRYYPIIVLAIVVKLATLYLSYRQTAAAYPNGGGAYVVAKDNFGIHAGLWAAVALTYEHQTDSGLAVSTPVWAPGNLLFVASAYGTGARTLQLSQSGGKTTVKELWYDRHLELHFGTAIQRDGYVYFSSGYNGPVLMTAGELKTGQIKWRERGFAKAQLLYADGKMILTDADGMLALCRATPQKFEVLSKASVLQSIAWTPPTLVGAQLYVRDRRTIQAFDLAR